MILSQGWMQGPMHDMGGMMGGWFGWLWLLLSFAFFLLLAGALIALIRYFWVKSGPQGGGGKSALDILKERYARGEISADEYERMRQEIE